MLRELVFIEVTTRGTDEINPFPWMNLFGFFFVSFFFCFCSLAVADCSRATLLVLFLCSSPVRGGRTVTKEVVRNEMEPLTVLSFSFSCFFFASSLFRRPAADGSPLRVDQTGAKRRKYPEYSRREFPLGWVHSWKPLLSPPPSSNGNGFFRRNEASSSAAGGAVISRSSAGADWRWTGVIDGRDINGKSKRRGSLVVGVGPNQTARESRQHLHHVIRIVDLDEVGSPVTIKS